MAIGLFVFGVAISNIVRGARADFGAYLGCGERTRHWACWTARIGHFSRGMASFPVGFFLCRAALRMQPDAAKSLAGALETLQQQPYGS